MKTKIHEGGRLVIPAPYRKAMGLKPGDEVLVFMEEGEIRVVSLRQSIQQAQGFIKCYNPEGRTLSEELLKDRREEASRE
ncbi:MAG: AbrB/MazE/SpoVT family DNA-binding domain-containing protein [Dehalococcoidaceae bacterium]|nr:AbrB/MazE/SpoVT family DNA-binding domain-containing protein [Dehalococcoidaceae bacterium]